RPDACAEPRILRDVGACAAGVCGFGVRDAEWPPGAMVVAARVWRDRVDHVVSVCVDYGVLHGVDLPSGTVDCKGFADWPGDEHYQRTCCRDGDAGTAGDCDLGGAAVELLLWRAGAGGGYDDQRLCEGYLRHGDRDDGHAELRGIHSGDGYVWAD